MSSVDVFFSAAIEQQQNGNFTIAEKLYRAVLCIDPTHADAANNLGQVCDPAEAEAFFRLAIKLAPEHIDAHANLGRLLLQQNRRTEAIQCFELVLRFAPEYEGIQALREENVAIRRNDRWDYIVSLGNNCEVAHNARRYFGQTTSFFFDWTQTPLASLKQLIETDFADVFQRENLVLHNNETTVLDTANGLWFHHNFTRQADHKVLAESVDREYPHQRRIIQFLINSWREVMSGPNSILFVCLPAPGDLPDLAADAQKLLDFLTAAYPAPTIQLLVIQRPDEVRQPDRGNLLFRVGEICRNGGGFGYTPSWDEAFDSVAP